jgi:hypothetical protein
MGKKTNPTATLVLTETAFKIALNGLHDQLLEASRYVGSTRVADKPGPQDECCPFHLARYERERDTAAALKARKKAVEKTIKQFEKAGRAFQVEEAPHD